MSFVRRTAEWFRDLGRALGYIVETATLRVQRDALANEIEMLTEVREGLRIGPRPGWVSMPVGSVPPWMEHWRQLDKGDIKFYAFKDTSKFDYCTGTVIEPTE